MKNLFLTLALVFSFSINAQHAVMWAVDLKDGGEKQYLELESFYSEIHKEAVKQGLRSGWSVWKRTPKEGDEDSAAEYFIFDNYSSEEQMEAGIDNQAIAQKVYKGKMSRRAIAKMFDNSAYDAEKERRVYRLKAVDLTIRAGGKIKKGDKATINLMNKKSDDFVSGKRKYVQKNDELNIDSKRREIPKEFNRSRAIKLDSKMYLTITTNDLYVYSYYEKKVRVIRKGKCTR